MNRKRNLYRMFLSNGLDVLYLVDDGDDPVKTGKEFLEERMWKYDISDTVYIAEFVGNGRYTK